MTSRLKLSTATTSILSGAILTAVLLFTALPRLHAEDIDRCQRRVAHAEHELHEAIEKHGRNSKKANKSEDRSDVCSSDLLFTALPRLHAEDIDRCQRRVAHAEHELHEAIEKHGRNSKKAN